MNSPVWVLNELINMLSEIGTFTIQFRNILIKRKIDDAVSFQSSTFLKAWLFRMTYFLGFLKTTVLLFSHGEGAT